MSDYLGPETTKVILDKIVLATPIIRKVFVQPVEKKDALGVYLFSDCGEWDTVVPKLIKWHAKTVSSAHKSAGGQTEILWFHPKTSHSQAKMIKDTAQVVYIRPEPPMLS